MVSLRRLGRPAKFVSLVFSLSMVACRVGPEAAAARAADHPPATPTAPQSAAPAPATAAAAIKPAANKPAGPHLELPANVDWQSWETGLARAKAENKPVVLLVWAHWCPRCRELAPTFGDPEIAELSKQLVMVEQNADDRPAWLSEKFDSLYGGYVPRVFVLRPDGTVRADVTSGNPQYPYFYVPHNKAALVESLKKALRG
jgi:thiol-disulfide isomerase/thioredoxin